MLDDVGPSEGQITQCLSQVGESFNALGTGTRESDLGLASSSTISLSQRVENERVEKVMVDDGYSSIDWTDSEEEKVVPSVQQETEPFVQEEAEPTILENAEHDIEDDGEDSDQSIDYGSDVHEELRIVKEDVRKFNRENRRNKKKEKTKGFLGEVGLDEGYEDIEKGKKNFKDKLIEDEPYYDSSDCDSFQSDDELLPVSDDELEGGSLRGRKKSNRVIYDSTCDVVIWQCGLVFESVKEFREAVTKYAIKKGVELDKYVNESTRVRVKCKSGCPWLLYASKEGRSENFTIKTYNPRHKCTRTNTNFLCNSKFLSKYLKDRIISQPRIKGWEIQDWVRKELKVYVGKTVCLKTRKLVLQEVMGDHVAEFNRILDYKDVLLQTNPGSTCVVKLTDSDSGMKQFHSFYICFDAMKKGFQQGCRRCIGLDGCFLKGICKGQLLVAVAKDGNNQMFPIAWAVVGTESKATWKWFMTILQDDLNLGDGSQITIISDMQKGLVAAADEVFPECEHRMCARHILSNWSQNWRGIERRKRFWSCARATFVAQFIHNLDGLAKLGEGIVEDLIKFNKEKWCKVYFKTFSKCDSVDNNMAESFNAWILGPRNKTIVSMLEEIRIKVMSRVSKSRAFADSWTENISPMAMMVFNTNVTRSMQCNIYWNGDEGFEVLEGAYKHTVNLGQQKCSCRSWELKGIPCAHGIAAMNHLNMDASQAISSWYRKETYLKAYSHFIQPVSNMKMWPQSTNPIVEPPEVRKMPGRPPKNRRKEIGEVRKAGKLPKFGIAMTCSLCKGTNHNKRSCPKNPNSKSKGTPTPTQESQQSSTRNKRGKGQYERASSNNTCKANRRGAGTGYKRPRVLGQGVFVSDTGYTCINQGLASSRRVNTGVQSSAHVTDDIGYHPTKGLKWKGKQAITQRELHVRSVMHRVQTRSNAAGVQTRAQAKGKSPSKKTS